MCEGRVIFVSDHVHTLSNAVLSAAAILHPFVWHHMFIPILPSNLLVYATAPMPYLIGVRRYTHKKLLTQDIGSALVVDVDSGELISYGSFDVVDLIGNSNTALKIADDTFHKVKVRNVLKTEIQHFLYSFTIYYKI